MARLPTLHWPSKNPVDYQTRARPDPPPPGTTAAPTPEGAPHDRGGRCGRMTEPVVARAVRRPPALVYVQIHVDSVSAGADRRWTFDVSQN